MSSLELYRVVPRKVAHRRASLVVQVSLFGMFFAITRSLRRYVHSPRQAKQADFTRLENIPCRFLSDATLAPHEGIHSSPHPMPTSYTAFHLARARTLLCDSTRKMPLLPLSFASQCPCLACLRFPTPHLFLDLLYHAAARFECLKEIFKKPID